MYTYRLMADGVAVDYGMVDIFHGIHIPVGNRKADTYVTVIDVTDIIPINPDE